MHEYTLATFTLLWVCSCYFTNMQTRANFMKSSLLLTKCLHHRQFSEAFLIWECQIKICFGCLFPYLFSLSLHKLLKKLPEQCLNFQLPFAKCGATTQERVLRLTSVLLFESLQLLQGKLQWPGQLRLYQQRHRARFSTWRSSIPKWRILFFTSANQWSCLNCIVSYCSSSHSSPKFSIIVLSEVFPVAFDCCALGFSLFFSWSTEKRSRSCPVSMVNRLELSCEITVLAMFSLNFWSLTEKKCPTWTLNL